MPKMTRFEKLSFFSEGNLSTLQNFRKGVERLTQMVASIEH